MPDISRIWYYCGNWVTLRIKLTTICRQNKFKTKKLFKMKKYKLRAVLFFGITMSIFFILRYLWDLENFTTKSLLSIILLGIMCGAITGILFGYLIGTYSKFTGSNVNIETEADENVLLESPANHYKGVEAVGGKLLLTNKKFIFKSHKFNIQNRGFSISLDEIVRTDRYKNIGISNGFSIQCKNGKTEKFVVEESEKWIENLK